MICFDLVWEFSEYKHNSVRLAKIFQTLQSFTVYIKYTMADILFILPLKLAITALMLSKDDFKFVS